MRGMIGSLLESRGLWLAARVLVVVVFAASGLAKLIDFGGGVAEMRAAGLEPAVLFNIVVAFTLLAGSVLVLLDRAVWLGAGALAVFLVLTIVLVHAFWNLPEPQAPPALFFALEHITVVGGLMALAIASHLRRRLAAAVPIGAARFGVREP